MLNIVDEFTRECLAIKLGDGDEGRARVARDKLRPPNSVMPIERIASAIGVPCEVSMVRSLRSQPDARAVSQPQPAPLRLSRR